MEHWTVGHTLDSWEDAEALVRNEFQGLIRCEVESVDTYWLGNNHDYQELPNNGYATRVKLRPLGTGPPCGGSVASGTMITLADGAAVPVQNLKAGMRLLSYDTTTNKYVLSTITHVGLVHTDNQLTIRTAHGLPLRTDNATLQKLWVKQADETIGWLSVTRLKVGDYLFNALERRWVSVVDIIFTSGSYTMYDIYNTFPYDYIANNYLDPVKEIPGQ